MCDFGLSIKINKINQDKKYRIGTKNYMAPQIVKDNIYTFKSDFWAIGVLFYRIITGKLPFIGFSSK